MLNKLYMIILLIFLSINTKANPQKSKPDSSNLPGVVINYSPAETKQYVGGPSIVILANGDYVVSHQFFGPGTEMNFVGEVAVFQSKDGGKSWQKISHLKGQWWSNLFVHKGDLYIMGTHDRFGHAVIRRSTDGGKTWTIPKDESSGLLSQKVYHTGTVPVLVHNDRIWRTYEERYPRPEWGRDLRPVVISAPVDSDLLKAENWTWSNTISPRSEWLDGMFRAWLEGNIVVTPKGELVNILRVNYKRDQWKDEPVRAAIVQISEDGKKISFDPENDFIEMPGGNAKFIILYDEVSGRYWSLVNKMEPGKYARNKLALISSTNLRDWEIEDIVLEHPDTEHHAFQYVDFKFEGDDIIFVSRTAWDGSHNWHDANYITFHQIKNFRGK